MRRRAMRDFTAAAAMTRYDVFNGDADGLCSLRQLRLSAPCRSTLVSGPKRDIRLLERVDARAGDVVTVLDVSMSANRDAVARLLAQGAEIHYFDHHHAGNVAPHPRLHAHLDPAPDVCTAMLVDRALGGAHRPWAVVAAFGDNLVDSATRLGRGLALRDDGLARLRELGEALNYNGYGDDIDDLIVDPASLYRMLERFDDPLAFAASSPVLATLVEARRDDLDRAARQAPAATFAGATVHVLPDEPWSRRVRGEFANALANRMPRLAHAVLTPNRRGRYTVSLRTPDASADAFCRRFPDGGGRGVAAGINDLAADRLPEFLQRLESSYRG